MYIKNEFHILISNKLKNMEEDDITVEELADWSKELIRMVRNRPYKKIDVSY